jgi:transposase InsO family protein
MNEHHEYQLRRRAIRLTLQGHERTTILARTGRSPAWLSKWQRRFAELGWQGLHSHSRAPHNRSARYSQHMRQLVVATRHRLRKRRVGLSGPQAIQDELRHSHLLRRVPSLATIKRILHDAHLIHHPKVPKRGYFPQPTPTATYVLHAMDWTARYLSGGAKLFVFHTVDVQTRALHQTLHTDKSGATVRAHALAAWQQLGLPDGLQLDNDAAFNGGYKVPRLFGAFVRLCLYLGIEPIFLPVGEPKRNSVVERLHGLWSQTFWRTHRFDTLAAVRRAAPQFMRFYTHRYHPVALQGATPGQAHQQVRRRRLSAAELAGLPSELPLTAGRVHFVRLVSAQGQITLLNETWTVGKRLAGQYVWATISTARRRLRIYHRQSAEAEVRLVKEFGYALHEQVVPLSVQFQRPYHRRKMFTML